MPVNFGIAVGVSKVIHIDGINEVRRFYFGGALLFALFLEKLTFFEKVDIFENLFFFEVLRFLLLELAAQ